MPKINKEKLWVKNKYLLLPSTLILYKYLVWWEYELCEKTTLKQKIINNRLSPVLTVLSTCQKDLAHSIKRHVLLWNFFLLYLFIFLLFSYHQRLLQQNCVVLIISFRPLNWDKSPPYFLNNKSFDGNIFNLV